MADEEKLYLKCNVCGGDGLIGHLAISETPTHTETWVETTCSKCGGDGIVESGSLASEFIELVESIKTKCNQINTDLNQMQADINYIKTKV